MSKKTHGMVVLSELSNLFVKISICDALSSRNLFNDMMHAKKLSSSTKSATSDKFIAKKTYGRSVECRLLI